MPPFRFCQVTAAVMACVAASWIPAPAGDVLLLDPARAVDLALEHHPSVLEQRERSSELESIRRQALSEALPDLTANASSIRSRDPGLLNSPNFSQLVDPPDGEIPGFDPSFLVPIPTTMYYYGLSVEQTIYSFGRVAAAVRAAGLRRTELSYQVRSAEARVARNAVVALYGLALARERLSVLEAERASRESQLEQAEAFLDIGTGTRLGVLQARTALSSLRPREIDARGQEEAARARLNEAIGRDPMAPVDVVPGLLEQAELAALPEVDPILGGLDEKPDLRALQIERDYLDQESKVYRSNLLPDITFSGSYGISTIFSEELANTDFARWDVGLFLEWPLYDGRETRSKISEIRSRQRQSALHERALRAEAERDIVATVVEYRRARESAAIAGEVVAEAEETLRVAEESYRWGAATTLDVLEGQRAVTQARFDRLQAVHDALVALADLHALLGRLPLEPLAGEDLP